jgi:hypothetical protein
MTPRNREDTDMNRERIYWTLKEDESLHFDGTLDEAVSIASDLETRWHAQGQVGKVVVVKAWPRKSYRFSICHAGFPSYKQLKANGLDPNWDRCGLYVRDDVRISTSETV